MKIELTDREYDLIVEALTFRKGEMETYISWLHDREGNKLAGAYTAIGEIETEIRETRDLLIELYKQERENDNNDTSDTIESD